MHPDFWYQKRFSFFHYDCSKFDRLTCVIDFEFDVLTHDSEKMLIFALLVEIIEGFYNEYLQAVKALTAKPGFIIFHEIDRDS